ncbi:Uncharacterised protein [Serratia fonticola]|uniref:Uncharacterized protein n=1 Tax=Serratia fonticola TaxID=47917 RepID=A0A4U9UMI4_SERFO|nr:Uncharacterised protein [Serratia fonticola]
MMIFFYEVELYFSFVCAAVLNLHIESLIRFRRYQRLLVFGCGFLITFMLLLVFIIGVRTTVIGHIDGLRQDFIDEHTFLEQDLIRRKMLSGRCLLVQKSC